MSKNYTIVRVESDKSETVVGSKAKKSDAIALAEADRAENRRTTIVRTHTGTQVHEVKGVRPMASTPRFSKVVEVPEGIEIPEGARPAYLRLKHDAILVHFADAEKEKQYGVVRVSTNKLLKNRFARTRDAGRWVQDNLETPKAKAKRLEAEKAAAEAQGGEQPEPESTPAPEGELTNA